MLVNDFVKYFYFFLSLDLIPFTHIFSFLLRLLLINVCFTILDDVLGNNTIYLFLQVHLYFVFSVYEIIYINNIYVHICIHRFIYI
jgi:hypothetical protein